LFINPANGSTDKPLRKETEKGNDTQPQPSVQTFFFIDKEFIAAHMCLTFTEHSD